MWQGRMVVVMVVVGTVNYASAKNLVPDIPDYAKYANILFHRVQTSRVSNMDNLKINIHQINTQMDAKNYEMLTKINDIDTTLQEQTELITLKQDHSNGTCSQQTTGNMDGLNTKIDALDDRMAQLESRMNSLNTSTTTAATTTPLTTTTAATTTTTTTTTPTPTTTTTAATTTTSSTTSTTTAATTTPTTTTTAAATTTTPRPPDNNVCKTPACKTLAARMLDLMDHSGREPCEDFYQYACGGVTDDPLLDPESRQRETLRLIGDSLKDLSPEDPQLGPLKVFYDSCTAAEGDSTNKTMWLSDVKAIVNTIVGPFGGGNTAEGSVPTDDTPDITLMLVAMMKIHFSPFFDLLLDVAEDGTDRFVLMLTPPLLLSPFSKDMAWAMCYEKHLNRTKEALESPSSSYDINNFYEIYSECVGVGEGLQARIQQMKGAVKELGLMDYFNYTNHKQGPDGLLVDNLMDVEFLLQDLYAIFPRRPDLRENHLKRKFKKTTLSYLQQRFSFPSLQLNWVTLVEALLGHSVKPDSVTIHLFFEDELYSALDTIDATLEPERVQRILLILLAERLYTDLVKPAQYVLGKPEYCLQVTTELLGDFVSSLYLHHLPRLPDREQKIKDMIRANTKAAEKELIRQPNLKPDEKAMWLNKLEAMSGETPSADPSIYILQDMNGTTLNDNFVNNCLALLSRYRSLLYQQYQTAPSAPSVLWSHFLRPFSASGISLYAPNKFLVPYAALEAPLFYWDVPNYVNYAGVGFMIAHEMMHSFDETGVRYNGTRQHTLEGLEHYVSLSECLSPKYRSPQSLTDASGLRANFSLGRLPLNEVLADSGAVKLAWEAYEQSQEERQRNKTAAPVPLHSQWLPWLELKPLKVYYLRIAQTQCTATTDIHMLSLMENEHLPPRLRVNLMLHNDPLFTEAFNCPAPAQQCPYVLG